MDKNRVPHVKDEMRMDVYTSSLVLGFTHQPNCSTHAHIEVPVEYCSLLCTMKEAGLAVKSIFSFTCAATVLPPRKSSGMLFKNGGMTGYGTICKIIGLTDLLMTAIADCSCMGVIDRLLLCGN